VYATIISDLGIHHIFAVTLFFWATTEQYRVHRQLALLRKYQPTLSSGSSKNEAIKPVYLLPHGGWFAYSACPHYFLEIVVYISFVILTAGKSLLAWIILVWVILELGVIALQTRKMYVEKFREKVPQNWKCMVPFVF
jgi:3-oxo-5-alpha-steroid 4-dehydrogenase 3